MFTWLFALLYGIGWGALRRLFGGWLSEIPVLGNRGFQCILMIGALVPLFGFTLGGDVIAWLKATIISIWLYAQFWSRGHGPMFDMGRSGEPSDSCLARYEKMWGMISFAR